MIYPVYVLVLNPLYFELSKKLQICSFFPKNLNQILTNMTSPCQRLLADGQCLLNDAQRLFADACFANDSLKRPSMNAGTSISQIMGDICVPREFSGFPATNILETPEYYELQSEVPGVNKESVKIEVPDIHTLTIIGSIKEELPSRKDDKMEEDASFPTVVDTQSVDTQSVDTQPQTQEQQAQTTFSQKELDSKDKHDNQNGQIPGWWTNERVFGGFGSFRRSFFFLEPIDVDEAKASIKNGVIKIIIQKIKGSKSNIKLIELED